MAWTKATRTAHLLARFVAVVEERETHEQSRTDFPTEEWQKTRIRLEQKFNTLRGTIFRAVINSTQAI